MVMVMTRYNFISHQLAGAISEEGDDIQGLLLRYYKHPVIIITSVKKTHHLKY